MAIQDELPKSRITLIYRTTINGQPQDVELPFRLLVLGDFSLGASSDRKTDFDDRQLRSVNPGNLDALMKDMHMSLSFEVSNRVNPEVEADLQVTLPIDKMKSFHPDEIVHHVPKLKALLLLKQLLLETQGNIDNRKDLRKSMYELFASPDALKSVLAELKDYESLRLPAVGGATAAPVAAAPVAAAPAAAPAKPAPSTPSAPPTS